MRSGGVGITAYKLSTSKTCTALRAYVSIQNNCKLFNDFNSTRAVIKVIIYTLLYLPLTLRLSLILWGAVNLLFIFIPPGCGDVNKHAFIYSRKYATFWPKSCSYNCMRGKKSIFGKTSLTSTFNIS